MPFYRLPLFLLCLLPASAGAASLPAISEECGPEFFSYWKGERFLSQGVPAEQVDRYKAVLKREACRVVNLVHFAVKPGESQFCEKDEPSACLLKAAKAAHEERPFSHSVEDLIRIGHFDLIRKEDRALGEGSERQRIFYEKLAEIFDLRRRLLTERAKPSALLGEKAPELDKDDLKVAKLSCQLVKKSGLDLLQGPKPKGRTRETLARHAEIESALVALGSCDI